MKEDTSLLPQIPKKKIKKHDVIPELSTDLWWDISSLIAKK